MSGEWIKVEISTADKPEVLKMARMLGIDRDAVFGKLIRFWAWIDVQCVDGVVDGVVDADIDSICHQTGFSAALCAVNWLICDAEREQIMVPNFGRHNGESAKKRALKNDRQAKWRSKTVDVPVDATPSTTASTREEKRREDIKEKHSTQKRTKSNIVNLEEITQGGVDQQVAADFLAVRKAKRAPLTLTAWKGIVEEIRRAGISIDDGLRVCIKANWQGFSSEWDWQKHHTTSLPALKGRSCSVCGAPSLESIGHTWYCDTHAKIARKNPNNKGLEATNDAG